MGHLIAFLGIAGERGYLDLVPVRNTHASFSTGPGSCESTGPKRPDGWSIACRRSLDSGFHVSLRVVAGSLIPYHGRRAVKLSPTAKVIRGQALL